MLRDLHNFGETTVLDCTTSLLPKRRWQLFSNAVFARQTRGSLALEGGGRGREVGRRAGALEQPRLLLSVSLSHSGLKVMGRRLSAADIPDLRDRCIPEQNIWISGDFENLRPMIFI